MRRKIEFHEASIEAKQALELASLRKQLIERDKLIREMADELEDIHIYNADYLRETKPTYEHIRLILARRTTQAIRDGKAHR